MAEKCFRLGSWHVDSEAREITNGGRVRRLSPRAMGVLTTLVDADGAVVSRSGLLDAVWPDVHVSDESLTQAIAEIRRAFGQKRGADPFVETIQKAGYRLAAHVVPADGQPHGPITMEVDSELPLRAHLAASEARYLRWFNGYLAYNDIRDLMEEAAAIAPKSARIQAEYAMLVGCTILHRGDDENRSKAALAAARRAVALRPGQAMPHCALGFVSAAIGRAEDCARAFQMAFAIDPTDAETHSLAAQAFFGLGDMETALVLAERSSSLEADDILSPYVAARAATALDRPDRLAVAARICLTRADARLRLTPDSVRASSVRAAALAMLGRDDEAWTEARRTIGEPNFRDMVALAGIRQIDAALDSLEALLDNGWRAAGRLSHDPVFGQLGSGARCTRLAHHFLNA